MAALQTSTLDTQRRAGTGSWLGLLASTLGIEDFERYRVHVRGHVAMSEEARLVVQVLGDEQDVNSPRQRRPLAAAERTVSQQELASGVDLSILHEGIIGDGCRVRAWVEPSGGELEFGALTARPRGSLALETTALLGGSANVVFGRPVATA